MMLGYIQNVLYSTKQTKKEMVSLYFQAVCLQRGSFGPYKFFKERYEKVVQLYDAWPL